MRIDDKTTPTIPGKPVQSERKNWTFEHRLVPVNGSPDDPLCGAGAHGWQAIGVTVNPSDPGTLMVLIERRTS